MNRFFCLQAKSRRLQIYTVLRAISRLFSAIMQYRSKLNAKTRTQTLYQYLSPLVAKDAYFDTGDGCTRWEITVHLAPNVVLAQANDS